MPVSKPFKAKFRGECVAGDYIKPGELVVWDSQEHWMENNIGQWWKKGQYRILHNWHVTCYNEWNKETTK